MGGFIPNDMYKNIAKHSPLNSGLKQFFSKFDSAQEYAVLSEQLATVRQQLNDYQEQMIQNFRNGILSVLPIYLIRDKASSSGGMFLRWRSITTHSANQIGGQNVWLPIVSDPQQPEKIRQLLAAAEKNRILINMQVSTLNYMLRQLDDCMKKIQSVDDGLKNAKPEKVSL